MIEKILQKFSIIPTKKNVKELLSTENNSCIQLTQVSVGYNSLFRSHTILKNIDLTIFPGEMVACVGENGSGKSTLLKTIAGFIKPITGTITVSFSSFGYISENVTLPPYLTVYQYLHLILQLNVAPIMSMADALALVRLSSVTHKKLATLSKGMRQRCMFALMLLQNPDLFLFDEPFSGLDRESTAIITDIMKNLKKSGKTVIYTTHENPVEQTDRVIMLTNSNATSF